MNVLSLFDGISCAKVALERSGVPIKSYTACEIDKYAISVSKKNHPTIVHKGNVKDFKEAIPCDVLIGGSPCQDLSIAKKDRKGLAGDRSGLFWEYVRIKELCKPTWFILENVASMSKEDKDTISKALGVEPILIDASLVSAQSRRRLFWTNIPNVKQPEDKHIVLNDIVMPHTTIDDELTKDGKSFCLTATYYKGGTPEHSKKYKCRTMVVGDILEKNVDEKYYCKGKYTETNPTGHQVGHVGEKSNQGSRVFSIDGKSKCLASNGGGGSAKTGLYKVETAIRRLTPTECERLQCLPDDYTAGISDTQRYKCLGNAFNVDVVAHILTFLPDVR